MRTDKGTRRTTKPWPEEDRAVIARHYPTGGPEACLPHLPDRTLAQIRAWASKHGYRWRAPCRSAVAVDVTPSKPGAPRLYRPEWQPLKPAKALMVRPGADVWRDIPSAR